MRKLNADESATPSKSWCSWAIRLRLPQSFCLLVSLELTKQRPNAVVLHRHMQVSASHRHIRMPRRIAHLGQCPPAGQRMADKRVAPMVNGQTLQPLLPLSKFKPMNAAFFNYLMYNFRLYLARGKRKLDCASEMSRAEPDVSLRPIQSHYSSSIRDET